MASIPVGTLRRPPASRPGAAVHGDRDGVVVRQRAAVPRAPPSVELEPGLPGQVVELVVGEVPDAPRSESDARVGDVDVLALQLLACRVLAARGSTSESVVMRVTSTDELGRSRLAPGTKPSRTTRPRGWRHRAAAARHAACSSGPPMLQNVL